MFHARVQAIVELEEQRKLITKAAREAADTAAQQRERRAQDLQAEQELSADLQVCPSSDTAAHHISFNSSWLHWQLPCVSSETPRISCSRQAAAACHAQLP